MAKSPGPPKAKTAAPAQFDMNSRERKGGKDGRRGPGRGGDDKRPPSHIVNLPPVSVDRGEGWIIEKLGKVDQTSRAALGAEYHLTFEGHEPLVFAYLGAARDRAKEAPPEKAQIAEAAADPVEEATAAVNAGGRALGGPHSTRTGSDLARIQAGPSVSAMSDWLKRAGCSRGCWPISVWQVHGVSLK